MRIYDYSWVSRGPQGVSWRWREGFGEPPDASPPPVDTPSSRAFALRSFRDQPGYPPDPVRARHRSRRDRALSACPTGASPARIGKLGAAIPGVIPEVRDRLAQSALEIDRSTPAETLERRVVSNRLRG